MPVPLPVNKQENDKVNKPPALLHALGCGMPHIYIAALMPWPTYCAQHRSDESETSPMPCRSLSSELQDKFGAGKREKKRDRQVTEMDK